MEAAGELSAAKAVRVTAKLAHSDAAAFATDTTKVWFQLEVKF